MSDYKLQSLGLRYQNTWDNNIVETSSVNQFQNGSISPTHTTSRRSHYDKVKRTRAYCSGSTTKATKTMLLKRHPEIGFGFSIRGGIEHGTGIFISNINKYSDAFSQGLQIGDQILKTNKLSFEGISHEEAVQYIQGHRTLKVMVLSLGVIPGSKVEHAEYQWIDCYGRPCSPLQTDMSLHIADDSNESNGTGLLGDDERKVNIVVGNNTRLGMLIRGGCEYGLGIFVAGIDEDSVADRSGIMVGEQVLDVNGISFINVSHADAAHIIRTSKMMTMILKDVTKLPLARIVYDQTEWIDKRPMKSGMSMDSHISTPRIARHSVIQQGIAGSQLNHQSISGSTSYRWIEEKAQYYLSEDEWTTLKYYIREYVHGNITVNGLVLSLLDLLDTRDKMCMIPEVRGIVRPQDIDIYDEIILRREVETIKMQNEKRAGKDTVIVASVDKSAAVIPQPSNLEFTTESKMPPKKTSLKSFKYRILNEDSLNSTTENITEDSMLSSSPQETKPRLIMDETIPEVGEEEPLYACIDRGRQKTKTNESQLGALTEYDKMNPAEFKTFSPPRQVKLQKKWNESLNEISYEQTSDFENNTLGFAFGFLNSEDTEATNRADVEPDFITPAPNSSQRNGIKDESDEDDGSVVSVSSLEYGTTPPQTSRPVQYFRDSNGNISNRRQRQNVIDIDSSGEEKSSLQNFKPRHLPEKNHYLGEERNPKTSVEKPSAAHKTTKIKRSSSPTFDFEPSLDHRYSNFSVNDIIRQGFLPTTRLEHDPLNSSNESHNSFDEHKQIRIEKNLNRVNSINIQNQYQYESSEKMRSRTPSAESLSQLEPKTYGKPIMSKSPRADFQSSSLKKTIKSMNDSQEAVKEEGREHADIRNVRRTLSNETLHNTTKSEDHITNINENFRWTDSSKYATKTYGRKYEANRTNEEQTHTWDRSILRKTKNSEMLLGIRIDKTETESTLNEPVNLDKNMNQVEQQSPLKEDVYSLGAALRAKDEYKEEEKLPEKLYGFQIHAIRSRIDAFNNMRSNESTQGPNKKSWNANLENNMDKNLLERTENGWHKMKIQSHLPEEEAIFGRTILLPKDTEYPPGFTIDTRERDNGQELYISEIQNSELKSLGLAPGNVIIGVDNKTFKKEMKKGLVSLIIRNAFSSPEGSTVRLTLKT